MGLFRSRRAPRNPLPRTSPLSHELGRILAFGREQLNYGPVYPQFVERDLNRIVTQFNLDPGLADSANNASIEADYYEQAVTDPEGFTRELAELVLPIGGLAAYGGARLTGSLLGWNFKSVHYLAMLDASLAWKHEAGVGTPGMAPYELNRWHETHGSQS